LADAEQMRQAFDRSLMIRVYKAEGNPPERYLIEYNVRGLDRGADGKPVPRDSHQVEVQLTSEYPRVAPKCKVLTPIFHPNIDAATVCVGDHWAAGERLVDLVVRIGELIAYQAYNFKSPLDGEAAMWADLNPQRLPIDGRDLRAEVVPNLSLEPAEWDVPMPEFPATPLAQRPALPRVPAARTIATPSASPLNGDPSFPPARPGKAKRGGRLGKHLVGCLLAVLVLGLFSAICLMYLEVRDSTTKLLQAQDREARARSEAKAAQDREKKANDEKEDALRQSRSANERAEHANRAMQANVQAARQAAADRDAFKAKLAGAFFQNGKLYISLRELDKAIAELDKAIDLDPKSPTFWNERGIAYYRKGQYQTAIENYSKALQSSGGRFVILTNRANSYGKLNDWRSAIQDASQAIRLKPDYGRAYLVRGNAQASSGQWANASDDLLRATQLPNSTPQDGADYALVRLQLKDPEGYRRACARLVEKWGVKKAVAPASLIAWTCSVVPDSGVDLNPLIEVLAKSSTSSSQDPYVRLRALGAAQFRSGKWEESLKTSQDAMRLSKQPAPYSAIFLAMSHAKLKHTEDARKWLTKARHLTDIQKDKKSLPWQEQIALGIALREAEELLKESAKLATTHYNLGNALHAKGRLDEAIEEYRAAIALDPKFAPVHYDLGNALHAKGRLDEAIEEYRAAIALDPKAASPHNNLGAILCDVKHDYDGAIAHFHKAIALDPKSSRAHCNLGNALRAKGQLDEAIQAYQTAIALDQKNAQPHLELGNALIRKKQLDAAIREFRAAIALNPKFAGAHYNLGNALWKNGQLDEAIAEYHAAIKLNADHAEAHCNLGLVLRQRGDFIAALAALKQGHELGSRQKGWPYPSAEWVKQVQSLAYLDRLAAEVLKGEAKAKDPSELLKLGDFCLSQKKAPAAAARLYADAFAAEPGQADDEKARHRYNAACAGALAGCGLGKDDPSPDDTAKEKLRRQALDWLRADLATYTQLLAGTDPKASALVRQRLQHWQQDADFRGVRGDEALTKLPEGERPGWRALWADVTATLARVGK
jgi:tetratricopeptide (TPR) repeat protein